MRNLASVPHLGVKSSESRGVFLKGGGKKFQRYHITELKILSLVDFAHPAAPQQSDNPIALDDHSARRKSSALHRARTGRDGGR
jgi:hypothetical protein